MKNILLTGSSGFIGSNLLNELSKKYKIYCIVRSKNKKLKKRNVVDIYFKNYINLNKKLSKINFFSVIHCATHYRKVHSKKDVDKMIESNIKSQQLHTLFDGIRLQDPGLIDWAKQLGFKHIHINMETGGQSLDTIQTITNMGVSNITLNHDIPYAELITICQSIPSCELIVQGPIIIQYAKRSFYSDYTHASDISFESSHHSPPIIYHSVDTDAPHRNFTFLDNASGHMMFAHFHRCLGTELTKLAAISAQSWLIDHRGESTDYLMTALNLYAANTLNSKTRSIAS